MASKSDTAITEKAVLEALAAGATSPTAVAKRLGFKSGSSHIIGRILAAVPDLKARIAANQKKADAAKTVASPDALEVPDVCPYRKTSGYAMVWTILFAHRQGGIATADLLKRYQAWSQKSAQNCRWDIHVVQSPRYPDGMSCHKSAVKAAQSYSVERRGDLLKLHLVPKGK